MAADGGDLELNREEDICPMFSFRFTLTLVLGLIAVSAAGASEAQTKTAIFAGGCFWCVEADFDHVPGVTQTVSGFTGGHVENPSYKQVSRGGTGHVEAVKISYDPAIVSYETLLDVFWHSVDPTDAGGQFCDRGDTYLTAIFVADAAERALAEASKAAAEAELSVPVVTAIRDAGPFYPAEDYHQDYYLSQDRVLTRFGYVTKAEAYKGYRKGCGRDARVQQIWGASAHRGIDRAH